jgi:molybdopterin/thiamine biosynthesis adenylyltransferase
MKFSMTWQEKGGLIIDCMDNVDCILVVNNTSVCCGFYIIWVQSQKFSFLIPFFVCTDITGYFNCK